MKSLNFNKLNIQKEDVLSKTQMKNILGGHGDGVGCKLEYEYDCDYTGTGPTTSFCCPGLHCEDNATNTGTICMK